MFDSPVDKKYNPVLAEYLHVYNCNLEGFDKERISVLNSIFDTGYFIKERLDKMDYYKLLRTLIEQTDFPLMIEDNVYYNSLNKQKKADFYLIKPVYFTKNLLYYRRLKQGVANDLKNLTDTGVWEMVSVNILDLSELTTGIRFAKNETEKNYLDFYEELLNSEIEF